MHLLLWLYADEHKRITFKSQDLAADLLIATYHFSRIVGEFVRAGRLVKVGGRRKNGETTYEVVDPVAWDAARKATS